MRTRRTGTVIALAGMGLAVVAGAACGGDDDGPGAGPGSASTNTNEVTVVEFTFDPQSVEVATGDDVTWTNEDDFDHQITVRDGGFESDPFGGGESVSTTFAEPGTYDYFCGIHNSMTGTVTVN